MRIVITGSSGQVGRALQQVLIGHTVIPLSHTEVDVADPASVDRIAAIAPDTVIHSAAFTNVDACEQEPERARRINDLGTAHVVAAAERVGARLVYFSTDYVFNGQQASPYNETDATDPINVYGRTKLAGERHVQAARVSWMIARTSWVFGDGRDNFVTNVLRWAAENPSVRLVKDQSGCPTFAVHAARAVRHLLEIGASGLFHVAGSGSCSWFEFGRYVLEAAGIQTPLEPITFSELKRPAKRPAQSVLNLAKLRNTGFVMPEWRQGVDEFLAQPRR